MKSWLLLLAALILSWSSFAQRTVKIRNLWAKPQVHVLFRGYTVSFTIKDINKALLLLAETGDSTYGLSSRLDEKKEYALELYPGSRTEYRNVLQPMIQKGVGAYLLTAGHAVIKRKRHKKLKEMLIDIGARGIGENDILITVYDPKNRKMVFQGRMKIEMYNKDLGID